MAQTTTKRQYITHGDNASTMTTSGNPNLKFDLTKFTTSGETILVANNDNVSTRWVAQSNSKLDVSFSGVSNGTDAY